MRFHSVLAAVACAAAVVAVPAGAGWATQPAQPGPRVVADPVRHGVVHPKGGTPQTVQPARRTAANMTYHGGRIMPSAVVRSIFWGTSWPAAPADKVTGLDSFYAGEGNSGYARTVC